MYRRLGPDTAAAGEGGRREWWAMRVISPISLKKAVSPPGGQASTHLASERESRGGSRDIAEQRFVVRTHCTAAGCNSTADRACGI